MNNQIFGNLTDWAQALDTLHLLRDSATLDDHQKELVRLLGDDGNWRLREAAVEAAVSLQRPGIETVEQILALIKRDDLYYNIRTMAAEALSALIPMIMENKEISKALVCRFINETTHAVSSLRSSPAPQPFHDALDGTYEQIQRTAATA